MSVCAGSGGCSQQEAQPHSLVLCCPACRLLAGSLGSQAFKEREKAQSATRLFIVSSPTVGQALSSFPSWWLVSYLGSLLAGKGSRRMIRAAWAVG